MKRGKIGEKHKSFDKGNTYSRLKLQSQGSLVFTLNISVVVRTRDKEKYFEKVLKTLSLQSVLPSEIIVVNNFSSKKSLNVLKESLAIFADQHGKYGPKIKLALISDDEFSHPYSTNLGISLAENEFVCITNAHSLPISFSWLEDGLQHFKDKKVACVSGFFYPHQDTHHARRLSIVAYYLAEKIALSINRNRFATTNCILRKTLWKEYPFDENLPKIIPETKRYGLEDHDWGLEMIARGFKVVIDPKFSVYHSHESGLEEIKRNLRNFLVYRKIEKKVRQLKRPRRSFSRLKQALPALAEEIRDLVEK